MGAHAVRGRRTSIVVVVAIIAASLGVGVVASGAGPAPSADEHARRGEVYDGLQRGSADSQCRGAYEARTSDGRTMCSHGPDPAPDGVDVRRRPSTEELAATTEGGTGTLSATALPCYGDGSSGNRVQALYVRASDVPDRFSSIASLIPQWAAKANWVFSASASATGGLRHVRWLTSSGACALQVSNVVLSSTGDDNITNTMNELKAKGFNRTDRKYLIWMDSTVYCGIGTVKNDDRALSTNANNYGPSYARVDSGCWNATNSTAAHELMHNLGGVQLSALHSSGGWHCTDESDRMCYPDASGVSMTYTCPSSNEQLFDCNKDDYFNTAPAADSYLATHWNVASSAFLAATSPDASMDTASGGGTASPTPSPSTTPTPVPTATPTPTPTPSPSGTPTTVTYSDSLNKKVTTRSYGISAASGSVASNLSFTRASSLTVRIRNASGQVLTESTGGSPTSVSAAVAAGQFWVEVTGKPASFTLTVTYPRP